MPVVRSKIVSRRVQESRPEKIVRTMNLREFYNKRNRVLIIRACGGLGDIFMHRMMFEDFKRLMPDAEIHFACPKYYHDAIADHPFVDKLLDCNEFDRNDYIVSYNTTTACGRAEMKLAPFSGPNRSDIWAAHCGVILTKHNMHIHLTEEEKIEGKRLIEKHRDREGPSVLVCPVSAMESKNLIEHQFIGLIDGLRERGCYPFVVHNMPVHMALKNDIPMLNEIKLRKWMGVIHQSDYIVSVDTSTFHCAGGMGKPLVGIFTWVDGKAYSRHYPTTELVQKHRDFDSNWTCGPCYNWTACPKTKDNIKPCLTELTTDMILEGIDRMLKRFPIEKYLP